MAQPLLIAPSVLSADFGRLASEIAEVDAAGADRIHLDVMDGHFVPNLTFGPSVVAAIRPATKLPLDVHLMMTHPEPFLTSFAEAGADSITVHVEVCAHVQQTLSRIRGLHKAAGVALSPHTPETALDYLWEDLDVVLVMSVNPGFGGQAFLHSQLQKIERIAQRIQKLGASTLVQVDGGLSPENVRSVADAGAHVAIAGAAIFGQTDRARAIASFRNALA